MSTPAANTDHRSMDAVVPKGSEIFDFALDMARAHAKVVLAEGAKDGISSEPVALTTQKDKLRRIAELRQEIQSIWRTTYSGYAGLYRAPIEIAHTIIDVEYEARPEEAVEIVSACVDGADITELADLLGLPDLVRDFHDYHHSRANYDANQADLQRASL